MLDLLYLSCHQYFVTCSCDNPARLRNNEDAPIDALLKFYY